MKFHPKVYRPNGCGQKVSDGDIYRVQYLLHEGSSLGLVNLHISQLRPWRVPDSEDTVESPSSPESQIEDDLVVLDGRI